MRNQLHEVRVQKSTSRGQKLVSPVKKTLTQIYTYDLKYYHMTLETTKNTGGSVLTIFGRSDFLGIFLKEMDFSKGRMYFCVR